MQLNKNGLTLVGLIDDLDGRGLVVTEPDLIKERLIELEVFDKETETEWADIYG